jgi:hypothetical protein
MDTGNKPSINKRKVTMKITLAQIPGPKENNSMRSMILGSLVAAGLLVAFGSTAAQTDKPRQGSPEFERMKNLVGTWKGKADMGQGPMEFNVVYHLVSGGSVLEERIFEGTPKEMVTMYYDRNGKLALTHYCMLGNRPGMILESSDGKSLRFDFDATCGVKGDSEMHMHSLTITFEDPDTLIQDWKLFDDGKAKESHPFTLKRVKTR